MDDHLLALHGSSTYDEVYNKPTLKLNQFVMAKIDFMVHSFKHEVGGFLVSSKDDPLEIVDFRLIKQKSSGGFMAFDDDGLVDYYNNMHEECFEPWQCVRIWAHTHPSMSAKPSELDELTFAKKFLNKKQTGCNQPWAGMFIRSKTADNYFRLAYNFPDAPPMQIECSVILDTLIPFKASSQLDWDEEVRKLVTDVSSNTRSGSSYNFSSNKPITGYSASDLRDADKIGGLLLDSVPSRFETDKTLDSDDEKILREIENSEIVLASENDDEEDDRVVTASGRIGFMRYERDVDVLYRESHQEYKQEPVKCQLPPSPKTASSDKKVSSQGKKSSKKG